MNKKVRILMIAAFSLLLVNEGNSSCQTSNPDTLSRRVPVWTANIAIPVFTHVALYKTWYSKYQTTAFHWKNDQKEWLGMDKAGHFFSGFFIAAGSSSSFKYAGYNQKKSAIFGSSIALGFQSAIEYFDGHSSGWGASQADLMANTGGVLLSGFQEYFWGEIRIPLRLTFQKSKYAGLRPDVLGSTLAQRMLKDYNAQTYWIDFIPGRMHLNLGKFPQWLGFTFGYSAEGMLGGYSNTWTDIDGLPVLDYANIKRYRQFYLSPSVALGYIHTKKKWLKTLLSITNYWKIPLPALEITNTNSMKFHLLYW